MLHIVLGALKPVTIKQQIDRLTLPNVDLLLHLKSYHLILAHFIEPKNIIQEKIKYNPGERLNIIQIMKNKIQTTGVYSKH